MESLIYENYLGQQINLNSGNYVTSIRETKTFEFSIDLKGRFLNEGKEFELIVICLTRTALLNLLEALAGSEGIARLNSLKGDEKPYYSQFPGKLKAQSGFYRRCFFSGIKNIDYDNNDVCKLRLSFFTPMLYWVKETLYNFTTTVSIKNEQDLPADYELNIPWVNNTYVKYMNALAGTNSIYSGDIDFGLLKDIRISSYNSEVTGVPENAMKIINAIPKGTHTFECLGVLVDSTTTPLAGTINVIEQKYLP